MIIATKVLSKVSSKIIVGKSFLGKFDIDPVYPDKKHYNLCIKDTHHVSN